MRRTLAAAVLAAALIPGRAQALENEDLLALVAMPLAVAAVSEMTDVPMNELIDVVTLMNDAQVPPAQFVEVVRYVPVALVIEPGQPRFVDYVQLQYDNGLRGTALVDSIETRLPVYGVNGVDLDVTAPSVVDIDDHFFPQVVRTRLAARSHPHGGPPGQLKKQLGVQTGAEVVHGTKPGRKHDDGVVVRRVVDDRPDRVVTRQREVQKPAHKPVTKRGGEGKGHDKQISGNPGHGGGNPGGGHGKGKGRGKG